MGKTSYLIAVIAILIGIILVFNGKAKKQDIFDSSREITVISREDGSGTRGAFTELFDVKEEINGKKVDATLQTGDITQSTGVMIENVSSNKYAIGYISLGSLNERVKALDIDNAKATTENIKNGSYKIKRPFNIATKGTQSPSTEDFINFILSSDGQKIIENTGYISATEKKKFKSEMPKGKITIAGSSSVAPVMEKLKE